VSFLAVGIYSEHIVGPSYTVTQRLYVHRTLKSIAVVEVDFERTDLTAGPLELHVELNRWVASYDVTFVSDDSGRQQVRSDMTLPLPLLTYSNVTVSLRPSVCPSVYVYVCNQYSVVLQNMSNQLDI